MSIAPSITDAGIPSPLTVPVQSLRQFTVGEYHKLIDDGFFASDEAFELLEGLVVSKKQRPATSNPSVIVVDASVPIEIPKRSLRHFTIAEYHRLIDSGFFAEDEAIELLEGLVVHKMGKKRRHSLVTQRLRALLAPLIAGFYVDAQEPIATDDSEPEPDISVVRGKPDDYLDLPPPAPAVPLVVEVAEGTLHRDRTWKLRIYARARIPAYWIVNLVDRRVEVYSRPSGPIESPNYDDCQIVADDGELPVVIEGREVGRIKVREILP